LCKWTNDSHRFLLEHFDTIRDSPSHIYHSALPFSPSSSWLYKCYGLELSQEVQVVKGLPAEWGTCSSTVSLGSRILDLSFQNNIIAVGTAGSSIIILNATTSGQEAIFSGHGSNVASVTYSPDGLSLVSEGFSETIKLWDVQTGGVVKTFHDHTESVISVSISADCTRIASGSCNKTVCLWDVQTGKCNYIVVQEGDYTVDWWRRTVYVSFSPTDPQRLLSVCDSKVQQWDTNGHQVGHTYDGSCAAFSPDGTQFVLYFRGAVTIQNSSSGLIVTKFQTDIEPLHHFCFSPDGRLIAAATGNTVYVWGITGSNPYLIETFTGHADDINSLTFSSPSSLISGSNDCSVKFWQIGSSSEGPLVADPITKLFFSDIIRSITLQAKDGIIITSESDGMVKTWDISTGHCKASFQTPAKDFHGSDAQLINGKLILGWCLDGEINIWDVEKGELLSAIEVSDKFHNLKISGDGSRVFCMAGAFIQAWSIQTGERVGLVELVCNQAYTFDTDDSRAWIHYPFEMEYRGWDFGTTGSSPIQLPDTPGYRLHPDGIMLWDTGLHRIKDTRSGRVVFQLPKRYGQPYDVQWNSQYLVALFSTIGVLVLDFSHVF